MSGRGGQAHNWWDIRDWEGSQHRAFEELCFQLRMPAPTGWETIKTAAPDGGVEWYDQSPDRSAAHGYQVKFVQGIDELIPLAKESAKTVGRNIAHRKIVRLEFLTPFDLSDPTPFTPKGKPRQGARDRWNENVTRWKKELPGLADVEIRYVGGGELLERLTRPGNEGRQWFFFEKRALGQEWFQEQIALAERLADSRYTPERHVALPLGRVVDACALHPQFTRNAAQRARDLRTSVGMFVSDLEHWRKHYSVPDAGSAYEALIRWDFPLRDKAEYIVRNLSVGSMRSEFPASETAAAVREMVRALGVFGEALVEGDEPARVVPEGLKALGDGSLSRVLHESSRLLELLLSTAAHAAEKRGWLLLGEAGQGKTHLLVDAARRAVTEGCPALVVFGHELSGRDPLSEIARRRGLGELPERDFLQAMDAAGEAAGCRFLLVVDALNDSDDARQWKSELLALQGKLVRYRRIALVVSCRSTFKDMVVPDSFDGPRTTHSGFSGQEVEGIESYLRDIPEALPRTPLLTSAFTNPLYVKLYAEGLRRNPAPGRPASDSHPRNRSAVFDAYVDHRADTICARLKLDPHDRPVHRAVNALAARMGTEERSVLPRSVARDIVDAFAPSATAWPDTMLGQLLAQDIVSNERANWLDDGPGIGFPYQAFGDDRVVRSVFAAHQNEIDLLRQGRVLGDESPLRTWLDKATPNHQEAASILLPEQTGVELIDLLTASPSSPGSGHEQQDPRRRRLATMFINTLPLRNPQSVAERTVVSLDEITPGLVSVPQALEAVLAVTAEPGHLLNADHLHQRLLAMTRPERDAWWVVGTYDMVWNSTALHRLLRWAEQYPSPSSRVTRPRFSSRADKDVVRLAAVALTWALTSSNRFLRDRSTKALVQLLLGHTDVLLSLLDRFLHEDARKVDDPYLFERLVAVAYGVLARHGRQPAELLEKVAHRILDSVYGDVDSPAHASQNALLCDAATRIVAMARNAEVITAEQASAARHPHACAEVGQAPDKKDMDAFPVRGSDGAHQWGAIRSSLAGLGDFAHYEVRPAVHHFSRLPLSSAYPSRPSWVRRDGPVEVDASQVPAFAESLPESVRPVLGTPDAAVRLLTGGKGHRVLNEDQRALLRACQVPPQRDELLAAAQIDEEWAARWVFGRVVELGWSPELFASFDSVIYSRFNHDRQHKAERIGKKYQWMALHELVERLANHRHPYRSSENDASEYPGAAQLLLLDIDPTLPPARHPFTELDDEDRSASEQHATFPAAASPHPLAPPAPELPDHDGIDAWLQGTDGLPDLRDLGVRADDEGRQWIVLQEQAVDDHDGRGWNRAHGQAEQWHHIYSWAVSDDQHDSLLAWFKGRSLSGRWMPEGPDRHSLYWADFPLAPNPWTDPVPSDWRVRTTAIPEVPSPAPAPTGTKDSDTPEDTPTSPPSPRTSSADDLTDSIDTWWKRSESRRADALLRLAEQWSDSFTDSAKEEEEDDDWLDPPVQVQFDEATDSTGKPVAAIPTTQSYSWSSNGHDCSLDDHVFALLPSDLLLRDSGLHRDPDGPRWYDGTGQLQVQYLRHLRPTGHVRTLLATAEWLEQRLRTLGQRLVQGSLGERQTVTAERSFSWREFSQVAGWGDGGEWRTDNVVTGLKRNPQ